MPAATMPIKDNRLHFLRSTINCARFTTQNGIRNELVYRKKKRVYDQINKT